MSGTGAPEWVRKLLEALLPAGYVEDVLADLEADARRRFGPRHTPRAMVWYLAQVTSWSMLRLAWSLRGSRARRTGRPGSLRSPRRRGVALAGEVRVAGRGLRRHPLFAIAAVVSLALGIGANAAVFSVVNAVLLELPPYADPDRLVFVWNRLEGFELSRLPLSGMQLTEVREETSVFEDVAGIWATTRTLTAEGGATLVPAGLITPNFFAVLGIVPPLGRAFTAAEGTEGAGTVIISDGLWRSAFGGAPDVVGRTVEVEGEAAEIVGVLPPDFTLHFPPDVGVPERLDLFVAYPWVAARQPGGSRFLRVVARLRPGASLATADAVVGDVAARLRAVHPEMAQAGDAFTAAPLHGDAVERIRPALLSLLVGVVIFLLLTSVNVASLMLARGEARTREMAIRTCIGGSRRQLLGLVVSEVAWLTALGTVAGCVLGFWGARALWSLRPDGIARVQVIDPDPAVFAFTLGAAALSAAIAATAPLLRLRRQAPMELLRRRSLPGRGVDGYGRRGATAAQLALGTVLVVGAALMSQTLAKLRTADLGFEPDGVLTFRVGLSQRLFPTDTERARLAREIEEELRALPGVTAAGGTSHIPLADWANWSGTAAPEGTPEAERERFHFDHRSVTPGYLRALGATRVAGRFFRSDDGPDAQPVVVIDEALAARAFPQGDAIGRRLVASRYVAGDFVPTSALVVGVIRGLRDHHPSQPSRGQVFWPFDQSARWELTYAVRSEVDPAVLTERIRAVVSGVRADLAPADVRSLTSYLDGATADTRYVSLLAGVFSTLALALAGLGLYGVVGYSAARRIRELGLRMALGARARDVFGRVLSEGLGVAVPGVALGLVAAAGLSRFLEALLFDVHPLDPLVFAATGGLLVGVAVVASAGPAFTATRVDPVRSLSEE